MNTTAFEHLPDEAKLWVYGFSRPLDERDRRIVSERLSSFVGTWNTHQVPINGAFAIVENRFVVVAAHSTEKISGCSIDSSVENFKFFRDAYGLDALNTGLVYFRNEANEIEALDRAAFGDAVTAGRVGPETPVFDLTIQSLSDLRAGKFETALRNCWHARAFPTAAPGGRGVSGPA